MRIVNNTMVAREDDGWEDQEVRPLDWCLKLSSKSSVKMQHMCLLLCAILADLLRQFQCYEAFVECVYHSCFRQCSTSGNLDLGLTFSYFYFSVTPSHDSVKSFHLL